ncbi:MAG: cation transporter [Atopobiaceae bacterium]|nr:cation transporter [Atopobiaceae bacterium]
MSLVDQLAIKTNRAGIRSSFSGNGRSAQILRTSVVGILGNILLATVKVIISFAVHSVAIAGDGLNNLSDALSSTIAIVGTLLSDREPDHDHPYGYGRIEYLITTIIGSLVVASGGSMLLESVQHMLNPVVLEYDNLSLVLLALAIVVKAALGWYFRKRGKELSSDALSASGAEATLDVVTSSATIASALADRYLGLSVDAYLAAVISLLLLKGGIEILLGSFSKIVGRRVEGDVAQEVRVALESVTGVVRAHDLRLVDYGPNNVRGSANIEVDEALLASEAERIAQAAKLAAFVSCHVALDAVGIKAVTPDDEAKDMLRQITSLARAHEGVVDVQGFRLMRDRKLAIFDVLVEYSHIDADVLAECITDEAAELFEGYRFLVTVEPLITG